MDDWECVRATSYIYPDTPIAPAQAAAYAAQGFEIGVHVTTDCANYTLPSLTANYTNDLAAIRGHVSTVCPRPRPIARTASPGATTPPRPTWRSRTGIRLDTNYYYWPASWVNDVPGMFTGSGMPMRFAQADGTMIDVYQAATQMTDESSQSYPFTSTRCSIGRSDRRAITARSSRTCTRILRLTLMPRRS